MHHFLMHHLSLRGVQFIPISNMGLGSIAEHAERAVAFISDHPYWKNATGPAHFLGHSLGGLVARATAHQLNSPKRVTSILTLATPHRGTVMATMLKDLPKSRPLVNRILGTIGYDLNSKLHNFYDVEPRETEKLNDMYPSHPQIHCASMAFSLPEEAMTWPVRLAKYLVDPKNQMASCDGIVERDSQVWGQLVGEFPLDHLNQIGFNTRILPHRRKQTALLFQSLCDELVRHWVRIERQQLDLP